MLRIEIINLMRSFRPDRRLIRQAVKRVLRRYQIDTACLNIVIVDDETISELHGRYLNDPSPTDVLSFLLEAASGYLEGEVIVSAETAKRQAKSFGVEIGQELLLYVIHGTLHLVGYDDQTASDRRRMRRAERQIFEEIGVAYPAIRRRTARGG